MKFLLPIILSCASARVVLESDVAPAASSADWTRAARAAAGDSLTLTLVMRRDAKALAELERIFHAVSDPRDARYGQHLDQSAVTALVAPPAAALDRTLVWLRSGGASDLSVGAHRDLFGGDVEREGPLGLVGQRGGDRLQNRRRRARRHRQLR